MGVNVTVQDSYIQLNSIFTNYGMDQYMSHQWFTKPTTIVMQNELFRISNIKDLYFVDKETGEIYVHPVLACAAIIHCGPPQKLIQWLFKVYEKIPITQDNGTQTYPSQICSESIDTGPQTLSMTSTDEYLKLIIDTVLLIKEDTHVLCTKSQ